MRLHYTLYIEPRRWPRVRPATRSRRGSSARPARGPTTSRRRSSTSTARNTATPLFHRYGDAFPAAYRADWVARAALGDIRRLEALSGPDDLALSLYRPLEAPPRVMRAKIFRSGTPLALSDMLPVFENLGRQGRRRAALRGDAAGRHPAWIYDFGLEHGGERRARARRRGDVPGRVHAHLARRGRERRLQPARPRGRSSAGARSPSCAPSRATCARPARRSATTTSRRRSSPIREIARLLVELFRARFDPADQDAVATAVAQASIAERIGAAIDAVASLDEDRILRQFLAVIEATAAHELLPATPTAPSRTSRSSSTRPGSPGCRCRARSSRSSSTRRASRACTCAAAASRAAGCAGRTGARTSAPRSSA